MQVTPQDAELDLCKSFSVNYEWSKEREHSAVRWLLNVAVTFGLVPSRMGGGRGGHCRVFGVREFHVEEKIFQARAL